MGKDGWWGEKWAARFEARHCTLILPLNLIGTLRSRHANGGGDLCCKTHPISLTNSHLSEGNNFCSVGEVLARRVVVHHGSWRGRLLPGVATC